MFGMQIQFARLSMNAFYRHAHFSPAAKRRRLLRLEALESRHLLSTIHGVVFDDVNGNGVQEADESPLAGFTVFNDSNADSILTAGEDSVVTGADGAYTLNIPDGPDAIHYIGAVIPGGDSVGRWIDTTNSYEMVPIYSGTDVDVTLDFGFRFVPYAGNFYPVGGETLVNETVAGAQGAPGNEHYANRSSIAADSSGNYVVAWVSPGSNSQDQVFARVFNADGSARTGEILVATQTRGPSAAVQMPFVAMSGDGSRFAVGWQSYSSSTKTIAPFTRVYDSSGSGVTAVTGAVQVSPYKTNEEYGVAGIGMDSNGDFTVLITGQTFTKLNRNGGITQFQRFTRDGTFVGKRTQVVDASLINGRQGIGMDAAGNFVVMWQDSSVFAQLYSASGKKVGSVITVVADPPGQAGDNRGPAVAMNENGDWAVVWNSAVYSNQPIMRAQVFDAAGGRVGSGLELGTVVFADCAPSVAIDSSRNVTVAWTAAPDQSKSTAAYEVATEIRVRRFDSAGVLTDTLIVNTTTEGEQANSSVAALGSNGFVVQWNGRGAGDDAGIFVQRYTASSSSSATLSTASALSAPAVDSLMSDESFGAVRKRR